ncbi:hypothetical protein BAC7755_50050 [Bacillus sp. MN7755]
MKLYRRFFKYIYRNLQYINDFFNYINYSTRDIDLPTNIDKTSRFVTKGNSRSKLDIFNLNVTINIYD